MRAITSLDSGGALANGIHRIYVWAAGTSCTPPVKHDAGLKT